MTAPTLTLYPAIGDTPYPSPNGLGLVATIPDALTAGTLIGLAVADTSGTATLTVPSGFAQLGSWTHTSGGRLSVFTATLGATTTGVSTYEINVPSGSTFGLVAQPFTLVGEVGSPTVVNGTATAATVTFGPYTSNSDAVQLALLAMIGTAGQLLDQRMNSTHRTELANAALLTSTTTATFPALTVGLDTRNQWVHTSDTAHLIYASLIWATTGGSTPPGPVQNIAATTNDGSAVVSWSAPASAGTSSITGYTIVLSQNATTVSTTTVTGTSVTLTGLTNGTTYAASVAAVSAAGTGTATTVTFVPQAQLVVPGPIQNLNLTTGDATITAIWSPPASSGTSSVARYTAVAQGDKTVTLTVTTTRAVFTGLTNDIRYTVTVTASSTAGTSTSTAASATPTGNPPPPPPPPPGPTPTPIIIPPRITPPSPWVLQIRNPDGTVGAQVATWTKLDLTVKFNDVGVIIATFPATDAAVQALQPGSGLIVRHLGVPFISGPIVDLLWTMDSDSASGSFDPWPGSLNIVCDDDLRWVRNAIALPNPASAPDQQDSTAYDTRSGPAETVARGYVAANVLNTAQLAERRTILTQDTDQGLGRILTSYQLRNDNLLTALQAILAPDGLRMSAVQGPSGPVFSITKPQDRSGDVFFSYGRHNLAAFSLEQGISAANVVLVGGSGQGTGRVFVAAGNTDSVTEWKERVESFVDRRDTADVAQMTDSANQTLAQSPDTVALTFTPADSKQATFGVDYQIGDIVGAQIGDQTFTEVVRAVQVVIDAGGAVPTITLGSASATAPVGLARTLTLLRALNSRVASLERRP